MNDRERSPLRRAACSLSDMPALTDGCPNMSCARACGLARAAPWRTALVALLALLACAEPPQEVPRSAPAADRWDDSRRDSLIAAMPGLLAQHRVPGASIALVARGEVVWTASFGVASPAGDSVRDATVFEAASLGKPVFASLVALWAARTDRSLEDSIARWLPDGAAGPAPDATMSTLLSHTAGLVYDPQADRVRRDPERVGRWAYSGAGYALAQRAFEAASGTSFTALADSLLFAPLGLAHTDWTPPSGGAVARGHDRAGRVLDPTPFPTAVAGSSLHTTAREYAQLLLHLVGETPRPAVSFAPLRQARAPVDTALALHWGLGWALETRPDAAATAFHWGSNPGFKSLAFFDPVRQLGLVVLTNGDHGLELIEDMVALLDPQPHAMFGFYMLHPDD